jgi:lipopolysaccharide/colanic/teichoic acid biosynthesis glycosyltransferase
VLRNREWRPCGLAKRILDIAGAMVLLVVSLPLFVALAVVIKLESRGAVLYRCRRVGLHSRPLSLLKFRKMSDGANGPPLTAADDVRFTRCGRWLAATKLDELPQIWNVLKGEMSLVGPRPEDHEFVALHSQEYEEILMVKPGITGLSQLAFAREATILDPDDRVGSYLQRILPAKVEIDLFYARSRNMAMDLRILAWTVGAVLFRQDVAVHRGTGGLGLRRRPRTEPLPARGTDSFARL